MFTVSLLWIRVEIPFDSKNYSAVVKSKIVYRAEQVIAIGQYGKIETKILYGRYHEWEIDCA